MPVLLFLTLSIKFNIGESLGIKSLIFFPTKIDELTPKNSSPISFIYVITSYLFTKKTGVLNSFKILFFTTKQPS